MCGFAGLFRLDGRAAELGPVLQASERLAHRGPDEEGRWQEGPAALAFRRLSILDLEHGQQPMRSEDGRLTIVYNGELYNHPKLREELEAQGVRYRTRSDTETFLKLYEREGLDMLKRLEGMFAFALWDSRKHEMVLARDPMGVKPLYYHFDGNSLAFASELRALTALLPGLELDPAGILDYLSFGFVHSPRTALGSALKLSPGHLLRVNAQGLKIERYWELPARPPWREGQGPSLKEASDETERLLISSVRGQLLSDVPVGAFLSGGVDSSLIAALMTRATGRPVRTFSIGFSGARRGLDETAHARTVARWLKSDHRELVLPADVLRRVEELGLALDEPIADSAILPTYLLSKFARESVKVVLTGEGADELFAGYGRYKAAYLSERLSRLPGWGRPLAAVLARRMGRGLLFKGMPHRGLGDWARASAHSAPSELEGICRPDFRERAAHVDPLEWLKDPEAPMSLGGALAFDLKTVLADCLLMKVDKAAMRVSLEARVPYLDRRLVEYAMHLPASAKIRRLKGKYILRRLARKYLPRPIVWRRKHGFIVPWEEWVRDPKNSLLDDLVGGRCLDAWGVFDTQHLRWMLGRVREGGRDADAGLFFRIAVLGLWLHSLKEGTRC